MYSDPFQDAQARYRQLREALDRGQLDAASFQAHLAQLQVKDGQGRIWQLDVQGQWLGWDGRAWQRAQPPVPKPPVAVQPAASPEPPPDPSIPAFQAAEAQLKAWRQARNRMEPQAYAEAMAKFRLQDGQGRTWQPDPKAEGWLCWDGQAWKAATAPHLAARGLGALRQKVMDPAAFLEMAKRVPISQRPQAWWDLLSILAGMGCGWLWFVYSSIRGMPYPAFLAQRLGLGRDNLVDFLPAFGLLLIPVVLVLARRIVAKALSPLFRFFQELPLILKLMLLGILLVGAYLTNMPIPFTKIQLLQVREGLDYITPLLMVGLPLLLVWFRKETDQLLAPLQPIKDAFPKPLLIGAGLMLPFFTAFVLYYIFGFSQYPLLRINTVLGTVMSYILVRHPEASSLKPAAMPRIPGALLILLILLLVGDLPLVADDFLRDPFNLNDGLRTNGIAPVLAGISTAVVSIFVNGVEVAKVMIQATSPVGEGEQAQHKNFSVQVHTVGKDGTAGATLLDPKKNDTVFIYAHCEAQGGRFPAGDPTISFSQVDAQTWVTVTDLGMQHGERCASAVLVQPSPAGAPPKTCTVTVAAGQDGLIAAPVMLGLDLGLVFQVFVKGGQRAPVYYSESEKAWQFPDAVAGFWTTTGEGPVKPDFQYGFPQPPFVAEPDILQMDECYSNDEGLSWIFKFSLKPGTDLTSYFGQELNENKGLVKLTITAVDEKQKKWSAQAEYVITPQLRLMAVAYEGSPSNSGGHEYNEQELKGLEFVADAKDVLPLAIFFVRTDVELDPGSEIDEASEMVEIQEIGFSAEQDKKDYKGPEAKEEDTGEGVFAYTLSSNTVILGSEERLKAKLKLALKAKIKPEAKNLEFEKLPHEVELKPLFLRLHLWVVPGQERGTSTAGAAVLMTDGKGGWKLAAQKVELELKVVSEGPSISEEAVEALAQTGGAKNISNALPAWLCAWKLRYSGLTWDTVKSGRFKVYVRFPEATEAAVFSVDVPQTIGEMIRDLDAHAGQLELTNPEWNRMSSVGSLFGLLLARNECRGFVYNLRALVMEGVCKARGVPMPEGYTKFVCGSYSLRLRKYLIEKRNGKVDPQSALGMNGFECCQYVLPGVHDWFGFHLSGTSTTQEPIFIDPWWRQEWRIDDVKDNYGFKKQAALFTAVMTLLTVEVVLLAYFLVWLIKAAIAGVGLVAPLELGFMEVFSILKDIFGRHRWYWHLANILANLGGWYLQTPCNDDTAFFDDAFNYSRYCELTLFQSYVNEVMQNPSAVTQKVEPWPE